MFSSNDERIAWSLLQRHLEDMLIVDEPGHWIDHEAARVSGVTRDIPEQAGYADRTEYLAAVIGWTSRVVHEMYHDRPTMAACPQITCRVALVALGGEADDDDG